MGGVRVEEEVEVAADRIWELVRDFGGIKSWSEGVDGVEVEGEGIGAVRTIKTAGIELQERLEAIDDAARSFSYAIISGPVPVQNYYATLTVHEAGEGRSRITWESTFEPQGASEEDCANLFRGVYQAGIAGVRTTLG